MDFIKSRDSAETGSGRCDAAIHPAVVEEPTGESPQCRPRIEVPRLPLTGIRPHVAGHALRRALYPVRRPSVVRASLRARRRRRGRIGILN